LGRFQKIPPTSGLLPLKKEAGMDLMKSLLHLPFVKGENDKIPLCPPFEKGEILRWNFTKGDEE